MKLYIAEKPSLGRAIAEALPKPHHKKEGYIHLGNGDCVSWCVGHLLEQAEPDAYDKRYKKWSHEHLPIIPEKWQLQAKPKTKKQLSALRKLVKQADQIIHAGDPDREGQLLVDQLIQHLGVKGQKHNDIQRLLINDLNPTAVKRSLQKMRSNREFAPLSTSALARSRADWLYGINMTRSYTLQGRKVKYNGVLSVGRVQTPVLGLVVNRDREIKEFTSKPFYEVQAHIKTADGIVFTATWQPSDACKPYMDDENRVLSQMLAKNVANRIENKPAIFQNQTSKKKSQPPPLPFSLSTLQIEASKQYGLSAKQTLDTCQKLYERHKLITYPRSDCRYLPTEHLKDKQQVSDAIAHNCNALKTSATQADLSLKSKAWNSGRVTSHHAIIPTTRKMKPHTLSDTELKIYHLVATQYLCQFYPAYSYIQRQTHLTIEGGLFVAKDIEIVNAGWKALFNKPANTKAKNSRIDTPSLTKSDSLLCIKSEIKEKQTQPPKHYTDASLLSAMTGISRFVKNPEIRKVLSDTDGLGTEATRASIIELLIKRKFITRRKKQLRATAAGDALIDYLPKSASSPDMTAQWEAELNAISHKKTSYDAFINPLKIKLKELIDQSQKTLPTSLLNN
ncbi:MAG: DNA topoisomerase III [Pseudomonadales bacterium]|nr:DNA topoisomerase III [Pseudomonadales bacterium]